MSDHEDARLHAIYDGLRAKLLDLTRRNRMLNYTMGPKARRQVQFVGADLQSSYTAVIAEKAAVTIAALDEPDDIPADERTPEFLDALAQARLTDVEYLVALEGMTATAAVGDPAMERLERSLRDRLRDRLELPPRKARVEVNRVEHARELGLHPETEFEASRERPARPGLQTLRYPDELEASMEKILDEARLAEQESGLSTLFLAFGFLEWYESESSEKPHYAPLLLLPVRAVRRTHLGRTLYQVVASEPAAEHNVSLLKFLELEHGRKLPTFDPGDGLEPASIDAYVDDVRASLEGLERWCVRRFVVLGHFAFSRIAIYEDVAPERWAVPVLQHSLVHTLLAGYEKTEAGAGAASFFGAEDYRIDDPAVERIAPFLIQDADASQHSAMVDVMNGKNLVIQGPPGTGKSQTIVNVIANALAADQSVLFVSEKQAALEVVKRRLDSAGLGDFCLELHSEKSSAKAVVGSLRDRHLLGAERVAQAPLRSDGAWATTRAQISDYLSALHAPTADQETPFGLIWRSIRGGATHADILRELGPLTFPASLFDNAASLAAARDGLDLYALEAQGFAEAFHHPVDSPWHVTPPHGAAAQDRAGLFAAIGAARDALLERDSIADKVRADGFIGSAAIAELLAADAALGETPDAATIIAIADLDLGEIEHALTLQAAAFHEAAQVAALPTVPAALDEALSIAPRLAAALLAGASAMEPTATLYARARHEVAARRSHSAAAAALEPSLVLLGLGEDNPAATLAALADAIAMIADIDESYLSWIARDFEGAIVDEACASWRALREEASALESLGSPGDRPNAAELDAAITVLSKSGASRLMAQVKGEVKAARAVAAQCGVADGPDGLATLRRLAAHLRAADVFAVDPRFAMAFGDAWAALATPLDEIEGGQQWRRHVLATLADAAGGGVVAGALVEAPRDSWLALAGRRSLADAYRATAAETVTAPDRSIAQQAVEDARALQANETLLAIDPDEALAASPLELQTLVKIATARERLARAEAAVAALPVLSKLRVIAATPEALAIARAAVAWRMRLTSVTLPQQISDGLRHDPAAFRDKIRERAAAWSDATARHEDAMAKIEARLEGLRQLAPATLAPHLAALLEHRDAFAAFVSLAAARRQLSAAGLGDFLERAEACRLPAAQLGEVFDAALARRRAEAVVQGSPALSQGTGTTMDGRRKFFAERDKARIAADRDAVRRRLLARQPQVGTRVGPKRDWTEMGLLADEFAKDGRFAPVRGLLHRARASVRALKPCFMMSPLSLAKFLTPGGEPFDLLVIDEASQMRPEDALGAMLRAKRMVVVGDPKQLPPTAFFARAAEDNDEGEEDDIDDESILERCQKAFGQFRRLKWHYRSRCESLIRFSNENFYDNGLVTFPASRPGSFSIDLVRVEGFYQARRNVAEAERVAEEAVGFMRHFADAPDGSLPTLGIVAMNIAQRDLIQETLRRLSVDDEKVATYREKAERQNEPPFVKNLENVQGDERDHVFISLTYGRAPGASAVLQRFGPVNAKQGHRRLNVLFSRARYRIALFTSLSSSDVVPTESSQEGVHVLKRYLEYAEGGGRAPVERIGGVADSDFELEVAERLVARGYSIDLQVGVSGFRIDLGVRHPDHPEMFLAGIECDGASYHSSKSARDRDRLREEVLRGLGWELVRVWSTDWFENPGRQTERLVARLEELRAKPARSDVPYVVGAAWAQMAEAPLASDNEVVEALIEDNDDHVVVDALDGEGASANIASGPTSHDAAPAQRGFDGDGPLSDAEAVAALIAYRETVIKPIEPQRSILRDGLIETFVRQRLVDPEQWYARVPQFQRAGTDPSEKRDHLEPICAIVARIDSGPDASRVKHKRSAAAAARSSGQADLSASFIAPTTTGAYVRIELEAVGLDRDAFYEPSYAPTLRRLVRQVIETEAPIYGDVLAMRIARAHGMERTGNVIRRLVAEVAQGFPTTAEEGREVIWKVDARTDTPVPYRGAAEHVRSHGDVPVAELASLALPNLRRGWTDDQVIREMALRLRLSRVRATVRRRLEAALAFARASARHASTIDSSAIRSLSDIDHTHPAS